MADDLLGLGVSAISQMGDFYLQNARELADYEALLERGKLPITRGLRLGDEDKLRRHIIMHLACDLRLDIADCNRRHGISFAETFARELRLLQGMADDGLVDAAGRRGHNEHSVEEFVALGRLWQPVPVVDREGARIRLQ